MQVFEICMYVIYCHWLKTHLQNKNKLRGTVDQAYIQSSLSESHRLKGGGPNMAEVGYCPIFVAENGNVVHISADSDTKIVNETDTSFSEVRKTEIVNIIVTDIGNHRS